MRVAVFLVCLCILLIRGYGYAYTPHSQSLGKVHLLKFINTNQGYSLVTDANSSGAEESLIDDDVQDEDPNSLYAKKYKLIVWFLIALSYILRYLYSCSKPSLTLFSPLFNRYITHKTLRI
jgi:hypothetical protein